MRKLTRKDKDAISAINNLISDIRNVTDDRNGQTWINRTLENLKVYVGENSELYIPVSYIRFSDGHGRFLNDDKKLLDITTYLNGVISFIREKGVLNNPEQEVNWFFKIHTSLAIFLLGVAISIITTITVLISNNFKSNEFLELKYEYKGLRDSLRISALNDSKVKSNSTQNPSNQTDTNSRNH